MTDQPCELCGGTYQLPDPDPEHSWHNGRPIGPCPRCLSVRATPAISVAAIIALGFDPWRGVLANQGEAWWDGETKVLPLHLSAGQQIAAAVIGQRFGHEFMDGTIIEFIPVDADLWIRWSEFDTMAFEPELPDPGYGYAHAAVPALAEIPGDVPAYIQIALALRHTLEATETP